MSEQKSPTKKTVITRTVSIKASKEKVWEALADFGNVQHMSPNISKSYLTSDMANGLGATRHCDFTAMGASVEEKIVGWDEGRSIKIALYDTKNIPMAKDMGAYFELNGEDGNVILTATFEYGTSGAIAGFMNNLAMKKMNVKSWVSFMSGIKHHVETGEDVGKETKLDLAVVQE